MTTAPHAINVRSIRKLTDNDGLTLKHGKPVTYKSGWQVAEEGCTARTAEQAMALIRSYNGNCGVWYFEGTYYIDPTKRVDTKREALEIGAAHNQQTVLKWATMAIVAVTQ